MRTKLQDLRHALVAVHKHLVDIARADYAKEHGASPTPQVLLHHLTTDDAFAWMRPISVFIVEADELLDEDALDPEAVVALKKEVELLVRGENAFSARYRPALQDPELIVSHGDLVRALGSLGSQGSRADDEPRA